MTTPISNDFLATSELQAKSLSERFNALQELKGGQPDFLQSLQATETKAELSQPSTEGQKDELKEAFQNFVGQTFFTQMLSSLRSAQEGAAYFNGGRAEKIFQGQLDQILSEEMTKASASQIADPMYNLFQLKRSS